MPRTRKPAPIGTKLTRSVRKKGSRHYSERRDEAVIRVVRIMLANKWVTGASTLELMAETGYGFDAVNAIASEASRFIRLCRGDVREEILRSVDHAKKLAIEAEMVVYDADLGSFKRAKQPDLAALRGFLQLQTEIHGLTGRASANAQRSDAGGEKLTVPIDELTELLSSAGYDVTKKEPSDG